MVQEWSSADPGLGSLVELEGASDALTRYVKLLDVAVESVRLAVNTVGESWTGLAAMAWRGDVSKFSPTLTALIVAADSGSNALDTYRDAVTSIDNSVPDLTKSIGESTKTISTLKASRAAAQRSQYEAGTPDEFNRQQARVARIDAQISAEQASLDTTNASLEALCASRTGADDAACASLDAALAQLNETWSTYADFAAALRRRGSPGRAGMRCGTNRV